MIFGYAGKFLEINLSTEKVKETVFDDDVLREYVGGRGLATKILWDQLGKKWETVDPLGPENILLFLTGPLTGFFPVEEFACRVSHLKATALLAQRLAANLVLNLNVLVTTA